MSDERTDPPPRRRPPDDDPARSGQPAPGMPPAAGDPDDPDAALERLQSLGSKPSASAKSASKSASIPSRPASTPSRSGPQPSRSGPQPSGSGPQPSRSASSPSRSASPPPPRVRRPAAPRGGAARYIAPAVFLLAVIVMISLAVQSGVIGGDDDKAAVSPTPKASVTKKATAKPSTGTKVYVIKSGDTLSAIAVKFGTSVSAIQELNPDIDTSTLVVGDKIKIPAD